MRRPVRVALILALLAGTATTAPAGAQPWRASVLARAEGEPAAAATDTSARAAAPAPSRPLAPAGQVGPPPVRQPWIGFPIAAGTLAAATGGTTGALIGFAVDRDDDEFFPTGIVSGFLVGEALLLPVGVHLGNARRGRFLPDLATSLLGGLGAIGLASLNRSGSLYVLGLGLQIGATVYAEREGARDKAADRRAAAARGESAPAPPPEPEPLVPPPPPER